MSINNRNDNKYKFYFENSVYPSLKKPTIFLQKGSLIFASENPEKEFQKFYIMKGLQDL